MADNAEIALCSQCGEEPGSMLKIGTSDVWGINCLDEAAETAHRDQIEAALSEVDRTWGGAAMVVKDTVLSILGRRCTDEFCEHDHAAIRDLRAPATSPGQTP